ncbi:hypothetical protein M427DRAFT_42442 [Gonapodya prolifera JEL478]|uniref:Uncharacterized protein n=1 Tax=Gonapodya prolifera (strain JEL478) TaxID=1344416 RepID=A0A139ANM9_GONPJ|nr:hypothetical protein M427DRAFT_42442 [Gonapodya prolifera JEL478]|eukprot:KXS18349.1 hypothetical protein M427DRAFT_42442 [Gonapodya prolifera JEL478]
MASGGVQDLAIACAAWAQFATGEAVKWAEKTLDSNSASSAALYPTLRLLLHVARTYILSVDAKPSPAPPSPPPFSASDRSGAPRLRSYSTPSHAPLDEAQPPLVAAAVSMASKSQLTSSVDWLWSPDAQGLSRSRSVAPLASPMRLIASGYLVAPGQPHTPDAQPAAPSATRTHTRRSTSKSSSNSRKPFRRLLRGRSRGHAGSPSSNQQRGSSADAARSMSILPSTGDAGIPGGFPDTTPSRTKPAVQSSRVFLGFFDSRRVSMKKHSSGMLLNKPPKESSKKLHVERANNSDPDWEELERDVRNEEHRPVLVEHGITRGGVAVPFSARGSSPVALPSTAGTNAIRFIRAQPAPTSPVEGYGAPTLHEQAVLVPPNKRGLAIPASGDGEPPPLPKRGQEQTSGYNGEHGLPSVLVRPRPNSRPPSPGPRRHIPEYPDHAGPTTPMMGGSPPKVAKLSRQLRDPGATVTGLPVIMDRSEKRHDPTSTMWIEPIFTRLKGGDADYRSDPKEEADGPTIKERRNWKVFGKK